MNHWIASTYRHRRIDDHVLLLQLERANEVLQDRVESLENSDDDDDPVSAIEDRVNEIVVDMREISNLIVTLTERVVDLERSQDTLLEALRRALLH